MHLITLETKPDGRLLSNLYDDQRRVLKQASTCGNDLNLITNATFVYSNNFVLTNFFTNTLSGYTTIADVFGKSLATITRTAASEQSPTAPANDRADLV